MCRTAAFLVLLLACAAFAEDNILSPARGARIIKRTSEDPQAVAANLIGPAASAGWRSADGSLPQEILFELPAATRFNTLVFTAAKDAPVDEWPRDVEVYTADPFPTMGGWRLVARATLSTEPGDQTLAVPPADGRFIRLLILSRQREGAARTALAQVKLFMR
ncbi:MAG TPA: discoidin domain-containing protein [Burkholderiales bacterium]|nr:discoidin domain-containing protein [Burkholderiales bacterium]